VYLLQRPEDIPPTLAKRVRTRVAVLAGILVAVLGTILFRLWSVQVLDGEHYRAVAEDNGIRDIRVQPSRGRILDRNGEVLVGNRTEMELELRPSDLPRDRDERKRVLARLESVAGLSHAVLQRKLREAPRYTGYPIVLKQGLSRALIFYLLENRQSFPGVSIERTFVRDYPRGSLAAHVLGIIGQVSPAQLGRDSGGALEPGDVIGQSGLERTYDRYLRGIPGQQRIQVDALGRPKTELPGLLARPGSSLRLTLDSGLQEVGEGALADRGLPGAFVAMDARTGAVLAIGSYPTFDPAFYVRPHTKSEYSRLEQRSGAPLINRAMQGGYPTGSAFKPITATAALEEGLIEPDTIFNDTGSFDVGGTVLHNAGGAANGPVDMSDALQVSSDVYFYSLGLRAEAQGGHGQIQDWARRYGLGERPGIDVAGASAGLIPTPAWRNRVYRKGSNPYIDRPWTQGDNVNLAIGQGDVQVTPLQLARAYAALANGGKLVTPHLGGRVVGPDGETVARIRPEPKRHLKISETTRSTILDGLRRAATEPGGTSYSVFGGFPVTVAGKTGTAERGEGNADQSWYAAIAPYGDPKIVVTATVEGGGFGVESAAPIVAQILERYFDADREATAYPLDRGYAGSE
jgi:penicillin-binding protein 2